MPSVAPSSRANLPLSDVPSCGLSSLGIGRVAVHSGTARMITLYPYPELYGVADNNPYGLKVFAFLKLCNLAFRHEHILHAKAAPPVDDALTARQRDTDHLIGRMFDDLYWVMSYSRW